MSELPISNLVVPFVFLLAVATTAAGALLAVLSHRIIRSVCGLALCCIGLAGLYYFLRSSFLVMMEILIYVGAVCVTIVFAVMLAEPDEPAPRVHRFRNWLWSGTLLLLSGGVFWGLLQLAQRLPPTSPTRAVSNGSVEVIGVSLLTTYSMAFELISLVLLVVILGALAIARPGRTKA